MTVTASWELDREHEDRLADAARWTRGPQRRHHHIARSELPARPTNGTSGEDVYDR